MYSAMHTMDTGTVNMEMLTTPTLKTPMEMMPTLTAPTLMNPTLNTDVFSDEAPSHGSPMCLEYSDIKIPHIAVAHTASVSDHGRSAMMNAYNSCPAFDTYAPASYMGFFSAKERPSPSPVAMAKDARVVKTWLYIVGAVIVVAMAIAVLTDVWPGSRQCAVYSCDCNPQNEDLTAANLYAQQYLAANCNSCP